MNKEDEYILNKYQDRILNSDREKVLSGQELYDKGIEYLLKRQKERNIKDDNSE